MSAFLNMAEPWLADDHSPESRRYYFYDLETATESEDHLNRAILGVLCLQDLSYNQRADATTIFTGSLASLAQLPAGLAMKASTIELELSLEMLRITLWAGRTDSSAVALNSRIRKLAASDHDRQRTATWTLATQMRFLQPPQELSPSQHLSLWEQAIGDEAAFWQGGTGSVSPWVQALLELSATADFFSGVKLSRRKEKGLSAEQRAIVALWIMADPYQRYAKRAKHHKSLLENVSQAESPWLIKQLTQLGDLPNDPAERQRIVISLADSAAAASSALGELALLGACAAACEQSNWPDLAQHYWDRYEEIAQRLSQGRMVDPLALRALWRQYHAGRSLEPTKTHIVRAGVRIGALVFADQIRRKFSGSQTEPWLERDGVEQELANIVANALRSVERPVQKLKKTTYGLVSALPPVIRETLAQYPDGGAHLPRQTIEQQIRKATGQSINELYDDWQPQAIAVGTTSQIHRARWQGQDVAVKVQKPHAKKELKQSFQALRRLAWIHEAWMRRVNHKTTIKYEEERSLRQLNLPWERANHDWASNIWRDHPKIKVPDLVSPHQSDLHSTFEYIDGPSISEFARDADEADRREIASLIVEAMVGSRFKGRFKFHFCEEDFIVRDGCLYVLDFSEFYDDPDVPDLLDNFRALINDDREEFREYCRNTGWTIDGPALEYLFNAFRDDYFGPILRNNSHITAAEVERSVLCLTREASALESIDVSAKWFGAVKYMWSLLPVLADLDVSVDYLDLIQLMIANEEEQASANPVAEAC